jgi:lysozyme
MHRTRATCNHCYLIEMIPSSKPKASREKVLAAAYTAWRKQFPKDPLPEMFVVGMRGYYLDTMGKPGANDRGIYDDAIFVFGKDGTFASFNANTDPSAFRKGVASLMPGWHPYKPGNHGISRPGGGYPAFRPNTKGEALPVTRDGESSVPSKRPGIAINIHKGGRTTTSSLGCQTLHPDQWDAFYALTRLEMSRAGVRGFWYGLLT